jgi:hypothetical protein
MPPTVTVQGVVPSVLMLRVWALMTAANANATKSRPYLVPTGFLIA